MHITAFSIANIRGISALNWQITNNTPDAGWHVILGGNNSGKTSIIRALSATLIGPDDLPYIRQQWPNWIQHNYDSGICLIRISCHHIDEFTGEKPNLSINFSTTFGIIIRPEKNRIARPLSVTPKETGFVSENASNLINLHPLFKFFVNPDTYVWGPGKGWFSSSFGAFRRFKDGDVTFLTAYQQNPKAAPHISIFGEDSILGEALSWLKNLTKKQDEESSEALNLTKRIINKELLPNGSSLHEINEDDILFMDPNEEIISINELSSGYISALSIVICLIHQLILSFGTNPLTETGNPYEITIPGVVLIDEVDAHLHPTWQQHIGFWLTKRFPNMQFIVTTHSPLICQAATTVYKLPTPGTDEEGRFLDDLELSRLKYGNIFEAYASEAFGKIDRSEEGKKKLERLADLTRFSWERDLTEDERREQAQLRAIFIDSPIGI